MIARRTKYALPIVAVFAWAGPAPTAPFSDPPRLEKPQAGFYRLKIGKVDVIAVNDDASCSRRARQRQAGDRGENHGEVVRQIARGGVD
jgi:hypothetical protein